jgi:hypothetical protein
VADRTVNGYANELDEFVSRNIKKIPYKRLQVWKEMLFRPAETIKDETKNASLARGARDIAVSTVAYTIVIALYLAEYLGFFFAIALLPLLFTKGIGYCIMPIVIGLLIAIAGIIGFAILGIVSWLLYSGFEFVIARYLGGKGEFRVHAYLEALPTAGMMAAMVPFMALYLIPCVAFCIGTFVQPIMMFLGFYVVYIRYLIVKKVHNLERNNALLAVAVPTLVVTIVVFAIGFGVGVMLALLDAASKGK